MKKILILLGFLCIPGCAGVVPQDALNALADVAVISKAQLRQEWPLVCFDPTDKMTKRTADAIDKNNLNRDRILGEEDCPPK